MSSTVTVKENGQGRYQQEIRAGKHQYLADEPVDMGGADAGPAPFDFIMSGLGACTSMTLRMYAERKELPCARSRSNSHTTRSRSMASNATASSAASPWMAT